MKPGIRIGTLNVFSHIGGRDTVCLNVSGDNLKIAYGKIYHTRKELIDLASYKIQGLSDDEIVKVIRTSLENLKLTNPQVILVIPAHLTIVKNIEIPSLDPQEIREIVDLQAGRHTPYSREEIIIDYIRIGTFRENYTKILLIIVTLSVVRRQVEMLRKAGLETEHIFFSSEAIADVCLTTLQLKHAGSVQTVIHIDSNFTDFVNAANGKLIFMRSIPIGTKHLIGEKERYQTRFVEEIKKSMEAYQAEDIDKISTELILAGAGEGSLELQNLFNGMLHTPVRRSFPYFRKMPSLSEVLKNILESHDESFLDVAAPLVCVNMPKVNLIPAEIKLRQAFEEKSKDVVRFGVLVMTVIVLVCLFFANVIYVKSAYLKKMTAKYTPIIESAQYLDESFSKMQSVKQELKGRTIGTDVLGEIYDFIPKNIQISDIKFNRRGQVSLSGQSKSMSIVFSFIDDMEASSYFKNAEPKRTTKRKTAGDEVVDFEITCLLETELR